jgi:hypothetical protein
MGGGIVGAEVGFDFDDAGGEGRTVADEHFAEEGAGYAAGIAGEKGAGEGTDGGLHQVES